MKDIAFGICIIGGLLFAICSLAMATGLTQRILDVVAKLGYAMFCFGGLACLLK